MRHSVVPTVHPRVRVTSVALMVLDKARLTSMAPMVRDMARVTFVPLMVLDKARVASMAQMAGRKNRKATIEALVNAGLEMTLPHTDMTPPEVFRNRIGNGMVRVMISKGVAATGLRIPK